MKQMLIKSLSSAAAIARINGLSWAAPHNSNNIKKNEDENESNWLFARQY